MGTMQLIMGMELSRLQWASADTLSTQAATISAGTTGITMSGGTAGNALPVNNTLLK